MILAILTIILETVQSLPQGDGNIINYVAGGIAVAGTSSAVTIAVIQTKLKQQRKDIDYVILALSNHKKEHLNFDRQTIKNENDMEWIKESLNEIKTSLKTK